MCLNIEQNGNWEDDDLPSMVGVPLSFETEPSIVHCISLLDWMETIRYFCAAECMVRLLLLLGLLAHHQSQA
jgi:hypothetical protein